MISWSISETRSILPTLAIHKSEKDTLYAYSKYDPQKELFRWISSIEIEDSKDQICLIGMGLGYHVDALMGKFPDKRIVVWELNEDYYKWFIQSSYGESLLREPKKVLYKVLSSSAKDYQEIMEDLSNEKNELIIIRTLLELIPEQHEDVKDILSTYEVTRRSFKAHSGLMLENFQKNLTRNDKGITEWLNTFKGRSMVLVSAGPSLTKQLPLLKSMHNETDVIIGCVGTALNPLLQHDIMPDFVMIIESQNISPQFKGASHCNAPLFYLSTASNEAIELYSGPTFIIWQKGYEPAEQKAIKRNEPLIRSGGSVATSLLDVMVTMGAKSIALVGQDLAFTNNQSHAEGTHAKRANLSEFSLHVEDYDQKGKVPTSRNLYIYLKWFEHYVKREGEVRFWNCTEGGAYIKGWVHRSLQEYREEFLNINRYGVDS
jgi:hypothetical protein